MKPDESLKAFEDFTVDQGLDLRTSTPREGIEAMLAFRAATACLSCSDDTLLYQWGTYDREAGKYYELNITRQFIEEQSDDDAAISQLSLSYLYKSCTELAALGENNCWEDGPANFRQFIFESASFRTVADTKPDRIKVNHWYV